MATGDSYKTLQYIYRVGKSSISEFVPEVFNVIFEELNKFIEVKTVQKLKKNFCNLYFNFDSMLLTTSIKKLFNSKDIQKKIVNTTKIIL